MSNNIVAVMAKYPELGKVKTRFAKTMGDIKALAVYNILLENLCKKCLPTQIESYLFGCFITPEHQLNEFKKLYKNFSFYYAQHGNNLGQRMLNAIDKLIANEKAQKTLIIGADIPKLNSRIIDYAFKQLSQYDIVIGPTDDGGYYLIGMKIKYNFLFDNISWGTSDVLDQTLQACQKNSLTVAILETLSDLDTEDDLLLFPEILNKMQ